MFTWAIIAAGAGLFIYKDKIFVTRPDNTVGLSDISLTYIPSSMIQYIPPDLSVDTFMKSIMPPPVDASYG